MEATLVSSPRRAAPLANLLARVGLNPTSVQVLSLGGQDRRTLLGALWRFNKQRAAAAPAAKAGGTPVYAMSRAFFGLFRRFNQLPCTVDCRQRRADLLLNSGAKDKRVLILGDDDLLSVELAQRGFTNVTVADCDERLLARITAETRTTRTPPKVVQADFTKGMQGVAPSEVVVLDPPYNVDAALVFLRLAIDCASRSEDTSVFLMLNPWVMGESFKELQACAQTHGFKMVRHLPEFNAYPLGLSERVLLRAAWRGLLGKSSPVSRGAPLLFSSDCFELRRRA